MTVDPTSLPGLVLLAVELLALAALGYMVARVALRQRNHFMALAQGLVIGPALWGLSVSFALHLLPGLPGAIAGWVVMLSLGVGLLFRSPQVLKLPGRTLAMFCTLALVLSWIALAGRQVIAIPDAELHLGLAALIRAGNWPPVTPWNPWTVVPYHYGMDLAIGLLAPPIGPDLAFTTELVGVYAWTSLSMVVLATLYRHGAWPAAIVLGPLMLTAGAWTLVLVGDAPVILQIPLPSGLPSGDVGASLSNIFWPDIQFPWAEPEPAASPPNIWKPAFPFAYALSLVVLEYVVASHRSGSWTAPLTVAALIAFLGLADETIALVVMALWASREAARFLALPVLRAGTLASETGVGPERRGLARIPGAFRLTEREPLHALALLRAATGPALAALLLAVGGSMITGALSGALGGGLSVGWIGVASHRHPIGFFLPGPGGLGLLGLGPAVVAGGAALLGRGHRLVMALAISSGVFLIAGLVLRYEISGDAVRLDGHARNFALLALLVAAALRLRALRPRWRFVAFASVSLLAIWPTLAAPTGALAVALNRGIHLANAQPDHSEFGESFRWMGRTAISPFASGSVRAYIREQTAVDARIFSPHPIALTIATGRPNASGPAGRLHLLPYAGPEYDDVLRFLEPAAVRRLGFSYVHATSTWVATLPVRAQRWLDDPRLFQALVQGEAESLYRIQPAFLRMNPTPAADSFEALRQAIPSSASVYLAPGIQSRQVTLIAMALPHARLHGSGELESAYLLSKIPITAVGPRTPGFVVAPAQIAPAAFAPAARRPIWWNQQAAVYAPSGTVAPLMPPPPSDFSIQLSEVRSVDGRIAFTATFTDRATDLWQGQDWVVVATDASPWRLPYRFDTIRLNQVFVRWFDGQVQPVPATTTHEYVYLYEFDPRTGTLAVWDGTDYTSLAEPQPPLRPGHWILAARPNINREEVGLIPVLQFTLAGDGSVTYKTYEGSLDAMLVR
ncbi:MAG: hypothetical protein OXG65_05180 [Chloroflexi bacterium]|nr:hypothetical protein [Chloroflexota bacterium]